MREKIKRLKRTLDPYHFKLYALLLILLVNAAISVFIAQSLYKHRTNLSAQATDEFTGAVIKTNKGDIEILFDSRSPKAVESFMSLAQNGFYDETRIHRVVDELLIEGGDPLSKNNDLKRKWGQGGPGYVFADEIHDEDLMVRGAVAMVNNGPNTNGSQFFILAADAGWLRGYNTIFAWVVNAQEVVEEISQVETGVTGIPVEDIVVERISLK